MARYWPDRQLDRVTPPQMLDARGKALLRSLDGHFAANPVSGFASKDPETCPASVLPALIAEYSMEEFITPGLPEAVVRQILKNRWALKKYKGYDKGVWLGLALLGMEADIQHWHQMEPKGPANTQRLTITLGDKLFPTSSELKHPRELDAATQMVRVTQRLSQDVSVHFGLGIRGQRHLGTNAFGRMIDRRIPRVEANAGLKRRQAASLIGRIKATATNTVGTRLHARTGIAIFGKLEAV
jgi:phage tail P2-like protein